MANEADKSSMICGLVRFQNDLDAQDVVAVTVNVRRYNNLAYRDPFELLRKEISHHLRQGLQTFHTSMPAQRLRGNRPTLLLRSLATCSAA